MAIVNKVYCNKCGKLLEGMDADCVEHVEHYIGYGSKKHDGDKLSFDLCTECFDDFIDGLKEQFEISPIEEREWNG